MQYRSYHDLLISELNERQLSNPSYSLRAFARDLDLSASKLSQVMRRRQGLSLELADEVASKLNLEGTKKEWFVLSVGANHARAAKQREEYKVQLAEYVEEAQCFTHMQLEYFQVISDWWHFAILELTYHKDFEYDIDWIAKKLDLDSKIVSLAIERMLSLGLVEERENTLVDTFKFLATPSDVPSDALKNFNSQLINKASDALYEQDVENREIASNIFALKKSEIPRFKTLLRTFRRELEQDAAQLEDRDAVYCLSMQFYELTTGEV